MLEADHKKWAHWIFNPYITKLLKKNFSHFYVVNSLPAKGQNTNLILTPNHISWWDGFFIHHLNLRMMNKKLHLMMLEEQLQRYWFFKKVGAFGINPGSKKNIIEIKKYFKKVMDDPNNYLVMYIQGEIEPFDKRPLQIQKGLHFFIKELTDNFYVLPVAFKIQFQEEKKPAIFVRFGECISKEIICENYKSYENAFFTNIEQLNTDIFSKQSYIDLFA